MATTKFLMSRIPLFILICLCMRDPPAVNAQRATLKPGQVLGFSEQLSSANGRFILGFFKPGDVDHHYLGVRYTDDPYGVILVWVANRTNTIDGSTANLTMDADGILKIMQREKDPIALNSNQAAKSSSATLENSGNFVVTELNADGSRRVLWQSFDYPTDALLPGMKLGVNLKTGQTWKLTSWLSSVIAAPGIYSLEWNSTGDGGSEQLVARREGEIYWTSGGFNLANQAFENVPWLHDHDTSLNNFNFSYVSNENERFFNYSVVDGSISRLVLENNGGLTDNNVRKPALLPSYNCKGYPGCVIPEPACKSKNDEFVQRRGRFQGETLLSDGNVSLGESECWYKCWKHCACAGYAILYANGTGCNLWSEDLNFFQDETGSMKQIYVLKSKLPPSPNNGKWWIWIIVGIVALLLTLTSCFLFYLRRKKLQRDKERNEEEILFELIANDAEQSDNDGKKGHDLRVFTFASIMAATNDFSSENKLGEGGFGPVYKGKLPEEQEVAVKRLSRSSGQGLVEFKNELILIAKLQHMNLVRLLGCCVKGDEKMLIYEFMPNKSLDFYIFDPTKRKLLDWKKRYNIIDGIAQGLLYLHKYSRLRVIHRDLKASNILLDGDINPKISDFGMARIFGRHDTEANTERVVGTYGYMSPEYAMEGNFSEKSDVYSFGVLLLEIVSGRKNTAIYHEQDHAMNLVGSAWHLWREGRTLELMDPKLDDTHIDSQVLRCIHVGLLCVQEYAADRPTMSDVISMIFNENVPVPAPKQAAFYTQQNLMEATLSDAERKSCSIGLSVVSEMEAR